MTYSLRDYATMMSDEVRGAAYVAALRETVTANCVVADIGAGPGVLGVYAAMLGARRVFLVEPDISIGAAEALAEENGVRDRIEIIRARSTDITLPERADVIVTDLRGVLPLFGEHLHAAADMRARHLAPGGICIPLRDTMYACLVDDATCHAGLMNAWSALPAPMTHRSLDQLAANAWERTFATADQMVGAPVTWATLDYGVPAPPLDAGWTTVLEQPRTVRGMLAWFDAQLTPSIGFSNSPLAPRALYGQAFFPFAEVMHLAEGDVVHCRLRATLASGEHAWTWSGRAERAGTTIGEARHASLLGTPLLRSALERRDGDFVPTLSTDGHILQAMLVGADGERSLASLAAMLSARFPMRFPSAQAALEFVSQHEELWA